MHFMERSAVEPHRLAAGYRIGPRTGPTLARGLGDAPATCSRAIRNIPAVPPPISMSIVNQNEDIRPP